MSVSKWAPRDRYKRDATEKEEHKGNARKSTTKQRRPPYRFLLWSHRAREREDAGMVREQSAARSP